MPSLESASKPERRRRIFLAARTVFVGSTARVRDRTAVKTLISRHPASFQPLKRSFGEDVVVNVISSMIDNGIFESELKAKLVFPKLYQPSPARNLQHDASKQEAARPEAEALGEASRSDRDIYEGDQSDASIDAADYVDALEDALAYIPSGPPSLFPSYLSYTSQHKLLNTVQRVLEDCCYDWATKWTPDLLRERRWSCSEAVELGSWSKVLPRRFVFIGVAATACESAGALAEALQATHQLRHAAVHRLPTSVKGIERMLQSALNLATALQDQKCMVKLNDILMDFKATMQDMELHKNDLESQLDEELRYMQDQRKVLDKREKDAKLNTLQQDQKNTVTISSLFEQSIRNLTSTVGYLANDAEHTDSRNVGSEKSESGAVAGDTTNDPQAENDETAAADAALGIYSKASPPRDIGSSLAGRSETAEQPIENESDILPSELDPDDLDLQSKSVDESRALGSSQ